MNLVLIKKMGGLLVFLLILSSSVYALPQKWQIVTNESRITFTGIQNNAPTSGSFKKFTGEIQFDPNHLNESRVQIVIDTNSVSTSYSDITATLLTADWLNVKLFPRATFVSKYFTKLDNNKYVTTGTLTIRNKQIPISLTFEMEELSKNKVQVKGTTTLKRTDFGIGQGEWADTNTVKDAVKIDFIITAITK